MKKAHFVSLGCPKNRVDTEVAAALLLESGFALVEDPALADVIVVNTCSFLSCAKQESIDTILELARFKEEGRDVRLVAMGCLAQEAGPTLAHNLPELDLVVGTGLLDRLPELLRRRSGRRVHVGPPKFLPEHAVPRILSQSPAYAYLKVADGCSRKCAFCTIPSIKGPFLGRSEEAIAGEASRLCAMGVKELVLVAQDLTQYGRPGGKGLLRLLRRLAGIEGLEWVRCMYLYPDHVSRSLLEIVGEGGPTVPYLDMPIQHIDDGVLRLMKRGTGEARLRALLDRIRGSYSQVTLRTTLIVGHPGEDDRAFGKLEELVGSGCFDHLGVFPYSAEPGTESAGLPAGLQVPRREAVKRYRHLMRLQKGVVRARHKKLIGSLGRVLVEGHSEEHGGVPVGRTSAMAPEVDGLVILDACDTPPGHFVNVRITHAAGYDLVATPTMF